MFVDGTIEFQELVQHYPVSIFGPGFLLAMTFVLPYAFVNYFPLAWIFGRTSDYLPIQLGLLSPAVAMLALVAVVEFWRRGIKHYESSGS